MELFKIRSSQSGIILPYAESFSNITENQAEEITTLQAKSKLTEKQAEKLAYLINKRDSAPELSSGAKTYCEDWFRDQIYKRKKVITSKYLTKGIECEQAGIDRLNDWTNNFYTKNIVQFENEYITGEPDIVASDCIIDIKNSYDYTTFPSLKTDSPNKLYIAQLQCYMKLTGKIKAKLGYTLENLPDDLIASELNKRGLEFTEENASYYKYDDIADELRIKIFEFNYNADYIERLEQTVLLCREYIKTLR